MQQVVKAGPFGEASSMDISSCLQRRFGKGFIDKLMIKTDQSVDDRFLRSVSTGGWKYDPFKGYYANSAVYDLGDGRAVVVQHGKAMPRQRYEGKLEFNPRHYNSVDDLTALIGQMVPSLAEPLVCRIDCTVAFPAELFPWPYFLNPSYMRKTKYFQLLRDDAERLRGFAFGKFPKRLNVYEHWETKELPLDPNDRRTFVELQLSNAHCPIQRLSELPKLANYSPFEANGVSFHEPDARRFESVDGSFECLPDIRRFLKRETKVNRKAFRVLGYFQRYGYLRTRHFFNSQGNWGRDFDVFKPHSAMSAATLDEIFRAVVSEWLVARAVAQPSADAQATIGIL